MRIRIVVLALLLASTAIAQPNFTIDLVAVDSSKLPGLHSFAAARGSDGKWLLAGGRTNGLHLFVQSSDGGKTPPPNAFPTWSANNKLWVLDPAARTATSAPLTGLPQNVIDALSATNAEAIQSNGTLFIIGGYGWSNAAQQMITFNTLTAIDVDATIKAILAGTSFASNIQQTSTWFDCITPGINAVNTCVGNINCPPGPDFQTCGQKATQACYQQQQELNAKCIGQVRAGQTAKLSTNAGTYTTVTGGGLERLGDTFYLVFGQRFTGRYSVNPGDYKPPLTQVYTQTVYALSLQAKPLAGAILLQVQQDPNDLTAPYNRRDLNVLPGLAPDGSEMIQVLGGVFVPGQQTAYRTPIRITAPADATSMSITVDTYQQYMSQYDCAVVPLFTRATGGGTMTNVLLGGISLYYVDEKTGLLNVDTGLPFIPTISALTRAPNGTYSEFYRPAPISVGGKPVRVGTDAKFLASSAVSTSTSGVIYLDAIKEKTLLGWMYGGILADSPNPGASNTGTSASSQLFEVWLDPAAPPAGYWATTTNAPQVVITPKP